MADMRKILMIILLGSIVAGIYFGWAEYNSKVKAKTTKYTKQRDKAINNIRISTHDDGIRIGLILTARWDSKLEDTGNSSVSMECVVSQTKKGKGRKIIASSSMKGFSNQNSDIGSLSCKIYPKDISSEYPYLWIRINSKINGKKQKSIILSQGKFVR